MSALSASIALSPSADAASVDAVETTWVQRAQNGDASAFRWLFDRHAPSVHRFARDLLRDPAAADEATQDTFVRAFDKLGTLRTEQRFRAWILGIARNVVRETRRRGRWLEALGDLAGRLRAEDEAAALDGLHGDATPESLLLDREQSALMERALERLSHERRAVLLLRFDHGLSCVEASAALGWTVAKVKVEVHRARAQLRQRVLELHQEGRP